MSMALICHPPAWMTGVIDCTGEGVYHETAAIGRGMWAARAGCFRLRGRGHAGCGEDAVVRGIAQVRFVWPLLPQVDQRSQPTTGVAATATPSAAISIMISFFVMITRCMQTIDAKEDCSRQCIYRQNFMYGSPKVTSFFLDPIHINFIYSLIMWPFCQF